MNTELCEASEMEGTKWEMVPDSISQPPEFSTDAPWLSTNASQVRSKYCLYRNGILNIQTCVNVFMSATSNTLPLCKCKKSKHFLFEPV